MKITAKTILEQYAKSGKRHLIITGWRGKGKTTLFNKIVKEISGGEILPGLTSYMVPKTGVMLRDNVTGKEGAVGIYCPEKAEIGKNMIPYSDGFYSVGIPALKCAASSNSSWVIIDEIGFLESREAEFQQALRNVMEERQLAAVVRKTDRGKVKFIDEIISRSDVFIFDLDDYDSADYWD